MLVLVLIQTIIPKGWFSTATGNGNTPPTLDEREVSSENPLYNTTRQPHHILSIQTYLTNKQKYCIALLMLLYPGCRRQQAGFCMLILQFILDLPFGL